MKYKIYLISNKPQFFNEIQRGLSPEVLHLFDGSNYPSFSKLVNDCVVHCPTEIVIIMSDKVRPRASHIQKMISLLEQGHGFVGMYRLGFFGFKKQLFRQVGMMDERYVGGGYEDDDLYIRLKEANISMYISEEVDYLKSRSSWNYALSRPHYLQKWGGDVKLTRVASRQMSEENYPYNLGEGNYTEFLPFHRSEIKVRKIQKYMALQFK
jgi:hypothetical protein